MLSPLDGYQRSAYRIYDLGRQKVKTHLTYILSATLAIVSMNYNKAMNISVWITSDGHAYFVKCHKSLSRSRRGSKETAEVGDESGRCSPSSSSHH